MRDSFYGAGSIISARREHGRALVFRLVCSIAPALGVRERLNGRVGGATEPMVHITRRVAPTPLAPTDPGYEPDPRRIQVLFSDWTPKNLDAHEETVEVYSNCEEVELFLNGKSLGVKALPPDASPRTWPVRFESGTLLAVAKNRGRIVARDELRTAGPAAKILLDRGSHPRRSCVGRRRSYHRKDCR